MTRYKMIGRPIAPPFTILQEHQVGDVFDADLDEDVRNALLDVGALAEVSEASSASEEKESTEETPDVNESASAEDELGGVSLDPVVGPAQPEQPVEPEPASEPVPEPSQPARKSRGKSASGGE